MTPLLFAPERRLSFARLGLVTLTEAGLLVLVTLSARDLLTAVVSGDSPSRPLTFAAIAAGGAFLVGWFRQVLAEDLGMKFANEVRMMLAAHAASRQPRKRLGALAVRLTGDLNPLREWASTGVAETAAGAAQVSAGAIALSFAAGAGGAFSASVALGVAIGYFLVLRRPLLNTLEALRRSRGRVASSAGDLLIGAEAIARYDAFHREASRLHKRAELLRQVSVSRRCWSAALDAPGAAATPIAFATLLVLSATWPPALVVESWALVLFGAGILSEGLRRLGRAVDAQASYSIAMRRLRRIASVIPADRLPKQDVERVAARAGPVEAAADPCDVHKSAVFHTRLAGDTVLQVAAGEVVLVYAADPAISLAAVEDAAEQSPFAWLRGRPVRALEQRNLARRIGLAAPSTPLLRGSLRRNLTIRRVKTTDSEIVTALRTVGLISGRWPPERRIDPSNRDPGEHIQALLRLARTITHKASVIMVAEPALLHAPDAPEMYQRIAELTGAAVVAASSAKPSDEMRQLVIDAAAAADHL
jgi:ABC-type multidrug transport system fused ATPase/permease subunit